MLVLTDHNKNADKLIELLLSGSSTIILTKINTVEFYYDDGPISDRVKLLVSYLKDKPILAVSVLKELGINSHLIEQYSTLYQ